MKIDNAAPGGLSNQPDFTAIKTKQNAAWSSGDYAVIGTTLQIVGEMLAESMDPVPGSRVFTNPLIAHLHVQKGFDTSIIAMRLIR